MPVVLGEEAEGHRGDWVVAPGTVEAAEQVLALLRGEMGDSEGTLLLPAAGVGETGGPWEWPGSQLSMPVCVWQPSWERVVTKETLTAPPQTLSLPPGPMEPRGGSQGLAASQPLAK